MKRRQAGSTSLFAATHPVFAALCTDPNLLSRPSTRISHTVSRAKMLLSYLQTQSHSIQMNSRSKLEPLTSTPVDTFVARFASRIVSNSPGSFMSNPMGH